MAGKTGTAQVMRIGNVRLKNYEQSYLERDHAWFAVVRPGRRPRDGGGGAQRALRLRRRARRRPAAAAIIEKYVELKRVEGDAFGPSLDTPEPPEVKQAPKKPPPPPLVPEPPKKESAPALSAADAGPTPVAANPEPPQPQEVR